MATIGFNVNPSGKRRSDRILGILAFLYFIYGAGGAQAALRPMSIEELAKKSEHILCGEVVKMECYWGRFLGLGEIIFTDVTFKVTDRIFGELKEDTVTVQVPGGQINDDVLRCPDAPKYKIGEKVLLFLCRYNGRIWNTGWKQGKYTLREPRISGGPVQVQGNSKLPIRGLQDFTELRSDLLRIKSEE